MTKKETIRAISAPLEYVSNVNKEVPIKQISIINLLSMFSSFNNRNSEMIAANMVIMAIVLTGVPGAFGIHKSRAEKGSPKTK